MVADRTGIDEDHVRAIRLFDRIVAGLRQLAEHKLGVADVHLAAVGLYVDRWAGTLQHARKIRFSPTARAGAVQRVEALPVAAAGCAPLAWLSIAGGSEGSSI